VNDTAKKTTKSKAKQSKEQAAAVTEKETDSTFAAEIEELKRDMRSAQIIDWAQKNRQQLIAAAVAVLLLLAGGSLWLERNKTQKESAANLYHKALASTDVEEKKAMLDMVIREYDGSGYAALAHLYMAKISDQPEAHLNALIHGAASTPELAWQARLDLAEWYLGNGRAADAKALLAEPVGKQYEQLRHYLLAEASNDAAEKRQHLQKSLDASSNDAVLKARVESMLSELAAGEATGS